ncbi:MAG TPA: phosphate acyltransferase PlsX [Microscillaceae bacterium]|jgi:glycerol-3-phosphate acyltransferase PlsX|nr:phosphate acyltransferase PlsX [Microscillaceae bacterium]
MRIALDAMGGDFAPQAAVEGGILAAQALPSDTIVFVGIETAIQAELDKLGQVPPNIEIIHAPQVIEMGEHPTKALPQKPQSSISIGFKHLQEKNVDAFCSAGNTGAMLVASIFSVRVSEGVLRPAIISHVPKLDGSYGIILDVGANTDCKPEVLSQFGILGTIYCQQVFNIAQPKVALLNVGEEEKKGNLQAQTAYQLLKNNHKIQFVGNIEGRNLFDQSADVIVCDGFVGNVVIKMAESYYEILKNKNYSDPFFDNFNFEKIGGSPVLGINGNVVIAHGVSNAATIKNALILAHRVATVDLPGKIASSLID